MNFFDKYFVFSHSEKRGILLFLIIIFLLCFIYWLIPRYFTPEPVDYSDAVAKMKQAEMSRQKSNQPKQFLFDPNTVSKDSLMLLGFSSKQAWNLINFREKVKPFSSSRELKKLYAMTDSLFLSIEEFIKIDNPQPNKTKAGLSSGQSQKRLFSFDPNTISIDSLKLLGLGAKTAKTLVRFREKSGGFQTESDLWKVFGITDKQKEELAPYVMIKKMTSEESATDNQLKLIDLNKASKEELMKAKGIGNVFSDRIIEYRDRIGGFEGSNQLTEVYGIDEEWMRKYGDQFEANSEDIKKIDINSVTFKELLSHPYFSYSQTQLIINYRSQHGNFTSLEQIRENNLIKPKHYRKIASYLSIK